LKRIFLFLFILNLNSCGSLTSYENSVSENSFGRKELKKKNFKEIFTSEMSKKINLENCYYNYYENSQINYKRYSYLRFFKNGQYAYFTSNENNIDTNNIEKANHVGYYIVENNILELETPTGNFNTKSYKVIWKFTIEKNILKQKKTKAEFEVKKVSGLISVTPNW
jgi:hypothetical protein